MFVIGYLEVFYIFFKYVTGSVIKLEITQKY